MAKKKAPLAIGSISALEQQRIVDRSDRIVNPAPSIKEYIDENSENKGDLLTTNNQRCRRMTVQPLKIEPLKPASGLENSANLSEEEGRAHHFQRQ